MWRVLYASLWLAGCGDDDAPPEDAAVDDGAVEIDADDAETEDIAIAPPAPVIAPAHVDMRPCPTGWIEREAEAGAVLCDPYSERLPCEGATAQYPGSDRCQPVGAQCPSGTFPDVPSDVTALYVSADAAEGGTGTPEAPFATIGAAVAAAAPGSTIVIGKGEYEAITIEKDLTLLGACAAETRLFSSTDIFSDEVFTVDILGDVTVDIRNLTIESNGADALEIRRGATVSVTDVVLDATEFSVYVRESHFVANDVILRGASAWCDDAARCEFTRAYVANARGMLFTGAEASLVESTIVDDFHPALSFRSGLLVNDGAQLIARELAITVEGPAFEVDDATADIERVSVRERGTGVWAFTGSNVTVRKMSTEGGDVGEPEGFAAGDGSTLELVDVYCAPTEALVTQGVIGTNGARIQFERLAIVGATFFGLGSIERTRIEGTDLVVESVGGDDGFGIYTSGSGTATNVERGRVAHVDTAGMLVERLATATFTDFDVLDIGAEKVQSGAVVALLGGTIALERIHTAQTHTVAVVAQASATISGSDLAIEGALPDPNGLGRGLDVSLGANAQLSRVRIDDAIDHAIVTATGALTITDASIHRTRARECDSAECSRLPYGMGISVYEGTLDVERFEVEGTELCGLYVGENGELSARHGIVSNGAIGACIGANDYDIASLTTDVRYVDNTSTLESITLPVPAAFVPPAVDP